MVCQQIQLIIGTIARNLLPEIFPVGFSHITLGISILFNSVMDSGVDGSIIDKAFISNDKQSI